jgi:hypothetical protein
MTIEVTEMINEGQLKSELTNSLWFYLIYVGEDMHNIWNDQCRIFSFTKHNVEGDIFSKISEGILMLNL